MRQPTSNIPGRSTAKSIGSLQENVETINGTSSDDILLGSARDNQIVGGDGNDLLFGGDGNDLLEGNSGSDTLFGDADADQLIGGDGDDELFGGDGFDFLFGDSGNDLLWGDGNADELFGGEGDDQLLGGEGNDGLIGDGGKDKLFGDSGNDRLRGGDGNDFLDGYGGGSDEIDILNGGSGADTFVIGDSAGVNYQSGGSGDSEDFSFAIFEDFSLGEDFIQVSGSVESYELVTDDLLGDGVTDTGIYLGDDLIAIAENVIIENFDRFISVGGSPFGVDFPNPFGGIDQDFDFSSGDGASGDFPTITFEDFDQFAFI